MWLPKDERRLLAGYYRLGLTPNEERWYQECMLTPLLSIRPRLALIAEYGRTPEEREAGFHPAHLGRAKKQIEVACSRIQRVEAANRILAARQLVGLRTHQHEYGVIGVTLKLEGYDLARKCAGILPRTGLWYEEYRKHWLVLLFVFLAGIMLAEMVHFLVIPIWSRR